MRRMIGKRKPRSVIIHTKYFALKHNDDCVFFAAKLTLCWIIKKFSLKCFSMHICYVQRFELWNTNNPACTRCSVLRSRDILILAVGNLTGLLWDEATAPTQYTQQSHIKGVTCWNKKKNFTLVNVLYYLWTSIVILRRIGSISNMIFATCFSHTRGQMLFH